MGNCLCKCKRNEEEVDESAEERESRERRRKVIADLVKLAVNDYGLTRVMENGFEALNEEELDLYYEMRDEAVGEYADDVIEAELLVLEFEEQSESEDGLDDGIRPETTPLDVMPVTSSTSVYLEVLQMDSVINRFNFMTTFIPIRGPYEDNNYLCDSDGSPIVLLTPRCLADDAGKDAWVLINFRNIIPESVRIQSRIGSDVSCYSNSHYSETSSAYSDTSSTDSDTSLTYSETSSNDSGEEVSVNPCHASYYSLWNHRVRRSIFLLEENPFSCRILDRSIPSSLNSSSISTSSISLCVPVESNSSPEANSQIENESASNSDTEVNKFNSLSEVKEDNAANTACSNEDTDETVVDNSCAWFWCKSDREEATTVVENASSVHTVNTEETQKAPVAVECYNTFSKSRKFKR